LSWHLEGHGIEVMVVPAVTDVAGPRITFRLAAGLPLVYLDEPHLGVVARTLKAAFDRTVALVATIALSPLLVVLALGVKLTSRGPVLFRQTRVGIGGREFRMWKFRSMVSDAEERLPEVLHLNEHSGILFKVSDDPRITGVGRFLRRWSLDELPQLWNVLAGHMSIVGPRPPLPSEVEQYDARVRQRLRVKPGLTGLWQVSGRSDLSWEEGIRLDLEYIERWSLTLDLVLITKTLKAVALRHGAR
ncbi:MAG: exopolysaccharide biosynthesis polyprenyl glycosylphosphotransferase, partial [Acidimicrobiales bacterium]|nr:exopolysaccharide biosynthesis polyprenyl glycosylphosphotransferase [Acidimicrobiales bacterium]